jgi:uncharacterized RmlC-like cupin family protein
MRKSNPIRIVRPDQFDLGTDQTPGSQRRAAIASEVGVTSALWGGTFEVEPGARTGVHHHGSQETVAFVLSGTCEIRWGEKGEFTARAQAGDFIHVPAFLPHMEINPSEVDAFRWVVVRSTPKPIVVNLTDALWP